MAHGAPQAKTEHVSPLATVAPGNATIRFRVEPSLFTGRRTFFWALPLPRWPFKLACHFPHTSKPHGTSPSRSNTARMLIRRPAGTVLISAPVMVSAIRTAS